MLLQKQSATREEMVVLELVWKEFLVSAFHGELVRIFLISFFRGVLAACSKSPLLFEKREKRNDDAELPD